MAWHTWLAQSWYFYRRHFMVIAVICLPWLLLNEGLQEFALQQMAEEYSPSLLLLIHAVIYPLYATPVTLYMAAKQRNTPFTLQQGMNIALKLWLVFASVTLLVNMAVFTGIAFFVLPGAWLAARLTFVDFHIVLNRLTPFAAIRQSIEQSQPLQWPLAGLHLLSFILQIAIMLGLGSQLDEQVGFAISSVLLAVAVSMLMLYINVLSFRIWLDLP